MKIVDTFQEQIKKNKDAWGYSYCCSLVVVVAWMNEHILAVSLSTLV
jgi:hypothetical protein